MTSGATRPSSASIAGPLAAGRAAIIPTILVVKAGKDPDLDEEARMTQPDQHSPAALPVVDTSAPALAQLTAALAATAEHYDRTAEFPREPLKAVHDAGILALGVAPDYGGGTPPGAATGPGGGAAR